ncbi:DUF2953 domain-containing protein [Clostridium sp. MB05]|uniref:DUF2953 domain-containing protein n=1 Tax=Clostridium sp. MB05 TaxID=3376682 RepID=UPI003981B361
MALILILLIIILLLIIPIPLKFEFIFSENIFKFKLFNLNMFSSNKGIENKFFKNFINKHNLKNKEKSKVNCKDKKTINSSSLKHKKLNKRLSIKSLYNNISTNKFKPLMKINGTLEFGVEDSASCAIIYGLMCNIPTVLNLILDKPFKVKGVNLDIKPKFNTEILYFDINSIFYFNVANIIYILYLIYISFEIKEVTPEEGD